MSHQRLQHMLARRYELTESEEAALRVHLESCDPCRRLAGEYSRDDQALLAMTHADPPLGLRQAVLTQAGGQTKARPRKVNFLFPSLAAAVVLLACGFGLNRGGWPFSASDRILSEPQAVRAALPHTVIGPQPTPPRNVRITARLGSYAGVNQAWLVTISGPGVSIVSPDALAGQLHASTPPILHRETAVVDGRTGAFVETYTASG